MIIYEPLRANPEQFVAFWSDRYRYDKQNLYDDNIGRDLSEQRILDLFRWKNGTPLSGRKLASVQRNFIDRRHELAEIENIDNAMDFLSRFSQGGAIWRIFWLHCWRSQHYPIYDQHVHRAMTFIENGVAEEIPGYDPRKIDSYIQIYLPFYKRFAPFDGRSVDKALWAFGKFINENNFPTDVE